MEKHLAGRKKRQTGKEKGTEMKEGKKAEKIWELFKSLNTHNCLK